MSWCPICGQIYDGPRNRSIFTLYDAVPGAIWWDRFRGAW